MGLIEEVLAEGLVYLLAYSPSDKGVREPDSEVVGRASIEAAWSPLGEVSLSHGDLLLSGRLFSLSPALSKLDTAN